MIHFGVQVIDHAVQVAYFIVASTLKVSIVYALVADRPHTAFSKRKCVLRL